MPETTALGAAMAAGAAEGVSVWSLRPEDLSEVTSEKFEPQINPEGAPRLQLPLLKAFPGVYLDVFVVVVAESEFRYARWKKAVQKSMNWETTEPVCNGNGTRPVMFFIFLTAFSEMFVDKMCALGSPGPICAAPGPVAPGSDPSVPQGLSSYPSRVHPFSSF